MSDSHLDRMIKLANEIFDTKNDPNQLDISPVIMKQLRKLHPATISEYDDGNGPVCWVLVIPTTLTLMLRFIDTEISEKQLFKLTKPDDNFEAIYLCSALTLPEYRRKGITQKLIVGAIEQIKTQYSIQALFVWPFTEEGNRTSEKIAEKIQLPLYKRTPHQET